MHLRSLFLAYLILFSYHSFGQTDNELKENKHRYSIEPYFTSGVMNTSSDIDRFRFHVMPGLNFVMGISKRSSLTLGANYFPLNGIHYNISCCCYPCPDAGDYKFINVSFGYKYDVYSRSNFSIEPFINIYEQITIYYLRYYYHNKENEQWLFDDIPYIGPLGASVGVYLNYNISDNIAVFITPSFLSLYSWQYRYLMGVSFGTRITF